MNKEYASTPLEQEAAKYVDTAFDNNFRCWDPQNQKMLRWYRAVRGIKPTDKKVSPGRSNIRTGLAGMYHEIAHSILKQSITNSDRPAELDSPIKSHQILGKEEMEDYLSHLWNDEGFFIKGDADDALWDVIACGTSFLAPGYEQLPRRIFKNIEDPATGEKNVQEVEVLVKSAPIFTIHNPWDCYPTANAKNVDGLHEIIYLVETTPQELRGWERQGYVGNVDTLINHTKAKAGSVTDAPRDGGREPVESKQVNEGDTIQLLLYWGLFPIYKFDGYTGDDGTDFSKDEVECLIIKGRDCPIVLACDRNPYFNQLKATIIAKYKSIPNVLHGEGLIEAAEEMIIHQNDWFNLVQDATDQSIYDDEVIPDNISAAEEKGSAGRKFHVSQVQFKEGLYPKKIERTRMILPEVYQQTETIGSVAREVTAITDFITGVSQINNRSATEIAELSQRVNLRFKERATFIEGQVTRPMFSWIMSLLSQQSDDQEVMEYTGLPFNPFKQFDAMIPNRGYRIVLKGALRASDTMANLMKTEKLFELALKLKPTPDEKGNLQLPNLFELWYSMVESSGLKGIDKFKVAVPMQPQLPNADLAATPETVPPEAANVTV